MTPARRWLVIAVAAVAAGGGTVALVADGADRDSTRTARAGVTGAGTASPGRPGRVAPRSVGARERPSRGARSPSLPLERAAARLFLVGFPGRTRDARFFDRLRERDWGAVLVTGANVVDPEQLGRLTAAIGDVAARERRAPPLVAAAQLGGDEETLPGVGPERQSSIPDVAAARGQARRAGRSLRRRGVDLVLAPSADLATVGGPWQDRGFSEDPAVAARLVAGAVAGWRRAGVAPVVGHFPGEGAASDDPALGPVTVGLSRDELGARDQAPFRAVVRTAPAIQLSGALYAGFDGVTPASLDPVVVGALRAEGFGGVIVSANLTAATAATGETVGAAAVAALRAGCDMLFVPGDRRDQESAYRAIVDAVRSGRVPEARLRDALGRLDELRRATG